MPKATRILPLSPYHNLSAGDLVDRLGAIKADLSGLQSQEKALRDRRDHRSGAVVTRYQRCPRQDGGPDWYDAHCRPSVVTTVAVKVRPVTPALAAYGRALNMTTIDTVSLANLWQRWQEIETKRSRNETGRC